VHVRRRQFLDRGEASLHNVGQSLAQLYYGASSRLVADIFSEGAIA
jgi:hypothetical protein